MSDGTISFAELAAAGALTGMALQAIAVGVWKGRVDTKQTAQEVVNANFERRMDRIEQEQKEHARAVEESAKQRHTETQGVLRKIERDIGRLLGLNDRDDRDSDKPSR